MKSNECLSADIIRLTAQLEENYPELYRFLDETPVKTKFGVLTDEELGNYLDTLKKELLHYLQTHYLQQHKRSL